jgi:hypothetical protein
MLGHHLRKETTETSVTKDVKYRTIHRRAHQKGHSTTYKPCTLVRTSTHVLRMRGKEHYIRFSNIFPTRCNVTQFILSGNCSTCVVWYLHPSSGAHTTVFTASVICHTVTAKCSYRGRVGTAPSLAG